MKTTKIICNYIIKLSLTTLFTILVMQETSTWYRLLSHDNDYSKYNTTTMIIQIILYMLLITTTTINFIIELKNSTKQ